MIQTVYTVEKIGKSSLLESARSSFVASHCGGESRSMSQDDLAAKTGLTKAAIYELEAGKRSPLTWTVAILARALGCPAGWLAFGG